MHFSNTAKRPAIQYLAEASVFIAAPSYAETAKTAEVPFTVVNEEFGIPVFPYDITDRPYDVLGEVKAGVRKATVFSKAPSQEKIYKELWERARKLGADAVVKANYGDPKITAFSWGSVKATGVAIKFKKAELVPTPTPTQSSN